MPFTPDEILALAFGEDLLRVLEGTVFHDSIRSALAQDPRGLGPELADYLARLGGAFRVLPGPHKSYAHLRDDDPHAQRGGARAAQRARSATAPGAPAQCRRRALDPYRVWYRSGGALRGRPRPQERRAAHVRGRPDRADRRHHARASRSRPTSTSTRYIGSSFGVIAEPATRVRILFDEALGAATSAERTWHPSQKLSALPDGRVELTMEVGGTDELRTWILSFGDGAWCSSRRRCASAVERELAGALARYTVASRGASRRGGARARARTS